jgi:protein kinase-like protein/WD40 domain-containing protein
MEALRSGDPDRVGGYRLLGRLGAGGMGQVFLGVSPGGRKVAVKLIHRGPGGTAEFRQRFAREVEAAQRVGGFHTALVVDADPHADPPWMVTAYIEGPSLREAVGQDGPLPPDRTRALGAGLAEGLGAIHACGLVHRDLTPGNVILADDGPRIIDFGVARAVDATTAITSTDTVVGTAAYMSPEQIRGQAAGPASDVFALGSVLAFAATGRPPFGGDSPAAVMFRVVSERPDLAGVADDGLARLITGCLAKSPGDRPTVPAVLAALSDPASAEGAARGSAQGRGAAAARAARAADHPGATQTYAPASATAATGREALVQPGVAPPAAGRAPRVQRSGSRSRVRSRRRLAALVAVAIGVALAATVPVTLIRGAPGTPNPGGTSGPPGPGVTGTAPGPIVTGTAPGPIVTGTAPGPIVTGTAPGPEPTEAVPVRDFTLHTHFAALFGNVAFSPDGKLLVAGLDGHAYLWDVASGLSVATLTAPGGGPGYEAFSPDGELLADADGSWNRVYLWDVATGRRTATLIPPGVGAIAGVAFSPDGKLLAVGDSTRVFVWDTATGRLALSLVNARDDGGVAFSPDGTLVAGAGATGRGPAFVWNAATGQRDATLYDPGGQSVDDVAFSPDGKLLAVGDTDGSIYLWDTASYTLAAKLTAPGRRGPVNSLTFSRDGRLLAEADGNGNAYLWHTATDRLAGTFIGTNQAQVWGVAFSPDGQMLAIADGDGNIYVRVTSDFMP